MRAGLPSRTASPTDPAPLRCASAPAPCRAGHGLRGAVLRAPARGRRRRAVRAAGRVPRRGRCRSTASEPPRTTAPCTRSSCAPRTGSIRLPYMALQADGRPWEGDEADPFGPPDRARQPFYPDASRVFEEIDRIAPGDDGLASHLDRARRLRLHPGGAAWWLHEARRAARRRLLSRTGPYHLIRQPSRRALARLTNVVADAFATRRLPGRTVAGGQPVRGGDVAGGSTC